MFKRAIIASFVVGAAITAAGPSVAQPPQGDPVYNTYYYSDSSHNEVVGINHGDCTYWGVVPDAWLEGQTSAYSEPILVAYCYQGNWQPL